MSGEKPWDRKARLERSLVLQAIGQGKALNSDAASYLLEHVGLDLAALEQEMLKLFCFVGERKQISLDDVCKICAAEKDINTWQLAEAIVWEMAPVKMEPLVDLSWLLPFNRATPLSAPNRAADRHLSRTGDGPRRDRPPLSPDERFGAGQKALHGPETHLPLLPRCPTCPFSDGAPQQEQLLCPSPLARPLYL